MPAKRDRPRRVGAKKAQPAVIRHEDGREICTNTHAGRKEYRTRRDYMWDRDEGICCICGTYVEKDESTFEHWMGRGMNGGHRDDRCDVDGKRNNGIAHGHCNTLKASMTLKRYLAQQQRNDLGGSPASGD